MLIAFLACTADDAPRPAAPATATTPAPAPVPLPEPTVPTVPTPTTATTTTPCEPVALEVPCDGIDQDCNGVDVCHPSVSGVWLTTDAELRIVDDVPYTSFAVTVAAGDIDADGVPEVLVGDSWNPATLEPAKVRSFAQPLAPPEIRASQAVRTIALTVYPLGRMQVDELTGDGVADLVLGHGGPTSEPSEVLHVLPGPIVLDGGASDLATTSILSVNSALYTATADVDGDGARELWWGGWSWSIGGQLVPLEAPIPAGVIDQTTLADYAPYITYPAFADDDADGADTVWYGGSVCGDDGLLALDHLPVGADVASEAVGGLNAAVECLAVPFGPGDVTGDGYDDLVLILSHGGPYDYIPMTASILDGPLRLESLREPWLILEGTFGLNVVEALDLDGTGVTDIVLEAGYYATPVLVEANPGAGSVEDLTTWQLETGLTTAAVLPDTDADGLDELVLGDSYAAYVIFGAM